MDDTGFMRKRSIALLLGLFCATSRLVSRQDLPGCGTHAEKASEQRDLHRRATIQREKTGFRRLAAASRDVGESAVLEDAGDIVSQPLTFSLELRTVAFVPAAGDASRYRFESGPASYDQGLASRGTILSGLADDDAREISLPFPFPFFGATRTSLFINSDGNLTFGARDTATRITSASS